MAELVASGRVVDIVLAVTLLEAMALTLWRRRIAPAALAVMLAPGVALMLALRAALTGAGWQWIALCLAAAGLAHLADLRRRLS